MIYTILNIILVITIISVVLGLIMGWIIKKIFQFTKIVVKEFKEC
jgi:type III secretory pathway component EscS